MCSVATKPSVDDGFSSYAILKVSFWTSAILPESISITHPGFNDWNYQAGQFLKRGTWPFCAGEGMGLRTSNMVEKYGVDTDEDCNQLMPQEFMQ